MQKYWLKKHRVRRLCVVGTVAVIIYILYIVGMQLGDSPIFTSEALIELNYYMDTMKNKCSIINNNFTDEINKNADLKQFFKPPECDNLLENLSKGHWVPAKEYDYELEHELNQIHNQYRTKVGISTTPWRTDGKCGYKILMKQISKEWPQTGTFCNPHGPNPCCTNLHEGKCVPVTSAMKCDCPACVDTSKYTDALQAEWITHDKK